MTLLRARPHWYMLTFQYGLGVAVAWQLIEDVLIGQPKIYSGEFYPWRQYLDWTALFGNSFYWCLAASEFLLLVLYFCRVNVRVTAALLSFVLFVDGLGSFLNHRLLMSIEMLFVSLCPAPARDGDGYRGKQVYWNLDLVRWQLGLVYLFTVYHKLNVQFLSGRTLHNLFFMTHAHGMKTYPDWLIPFVQNPRVCLALAWMTIVIELLVALAAQHRRIVGWVIPLAMGLHLGIGLLMGYIWIFTLQVIVSFTVFLPDRVIPGGSYVLKYGTRTAPLPLLRRIVWRGYVEVQHDPKLPRGWLLNLPDGRVVSGYDAIVELLSLSPLTFLFAETLRIAPARYVGRRLVRSIRTPVSVQAESLIRA